MKADRHALAVWLGSRVAVALAALAGAWQLSAAPAREVDGWLARWTRWDADLFRKVAEHGYDGYPAAYPDRGIEAFFPGLPLVLRAVHVVVPDWTAAGLLVSLVAGAVAAVALSRLGEDEAAGAGPLAVAVLVTSPYAVFLAAGYSEALFLALALPGWLAARRGRWAAAGVLVALAAGVRVTGVFLAAGLVVEYVVARRRAGQRLLAPAALWLLTPAVTVGAYAAYLHALTGSWTRWLDAQEEGWGRRLTAPQDALATTLQAAGSSAQRADLAWSYSAEVVAVAVGLAVTAVLARRRRWGEAVYVGLSVTALATSTYYLSVARASLLWFPLWLLLGAAATRRGWLLPAWLAVAAPLMLVGVVAFTSGRWVG